MNGAALASSDLKRQATPSVSATSDVVIAPCARHTRLLVHCKRPFDFAPILERPGELEQRPGPGERGRSVTRLRPAFLAHAVLARKPPEVKAIPPPSKRFTDRPCEKGRDKTGDDSAEHVAPTDTSHELQYRAASGCCYRGGLRDQVSALY